MFSDPRFLLFVPQNADCYIHKKMRSNISVNEMALVGSFAAFVKGKIFLDSHGERGGLPTRLDSGSTRYAVLPIAIYGFDEGLVSFRTLCGVQSSLVRFAPNRAIV